MKIKVVVDDLSGKRGCLSEHGLSLLIERNGKKILFDTGFGFSLLKNLERLNVKPDEISYIILSHGHDDHTGGLLSFLKNRSKEVEIYAHPDIFKGKYKDKGERKDYIGIPEKRETYEKYGGRFKLKREFFEIEEGLYFSGQIERINNFMDKTLVVKEGDEFVIDSVYDDISIGIKMDSGIFIVTGCNHSGLSNTLTHFYNHLRLPIIGVLGGLHLLNFEDRIKDAIDGIKKFDLKKIYPLHCTGTYGKCRLLYKFGDKVKLLKTCDEIEINR